MNRTRRTALFLGAAVLLLLSAYHFAVSSWNSVARGIVDFPIFVRHAERFLETGDLYVYAENLAAYAPSTAVYKFPPTYAMFLLPLVRNGIPKLLYYYHWAFLLAVYLGAVTLAIHALRPARAGPFVFGALLLALNLEPFFETLWRQQLEIPLLLLATLGLWAVLTRRDVAAGLATGLGAMLKIYPAFLLIWFAARRRWKLLAACIGAAVAIEAAALIVIGVRENETYFLHILPVILDETSLVKPENVALGRYLQELFGVAPMAAKRVSQGVVLALLAAFFVAPRRVAPPAAVRDRVALEYSLFLGLTLLSLPNCWVSQQVLLLPLYLVLLRRALEIRRGGAALLASLLGGYACLLFYTPCAVPEIPWPCAQTPYFLGLLQLPRGFHDLMVELRVLGTLLPVGAGLALLFAERRHEAREAGADA